MKGWALPGETRVQALSPGVTCLNGHPPPPVCGALGVIGLVASHPYLKGDA
jgi:hypothetical protein